MKTLKKKGLVSAAIAASLFTGICSVPANAMVAPSSATVTPESVVQVATEANIPITSKKHPNNAANAPKSKYIKTVKTTKTTSNLNLRKSASTSSKSLGVMKKGTSVTLTGKKSGKWVQLKWGSKTGWASSSYLKTSTSTQDKSARWMAGYTDIYASRSTNNRIGAVNFRTKVQLLDSKSGWSHIKTGYYHGWVKHNVKTSQPAVQYRWAPSDHNYYSSQKSTKAIGKVKKGTKYEWRRWDSKLRRDEVKINGKWVWTGPNSTKAPAPTQYRWAKSDQNYYASKTSNKAIGKLKKNQKYEWRNWDSKLRRDELKVNGKWVWAGPTNTKAPAPPLPSTVNVKDYGRFAERNITLREKPTSSSRSLGTVRLEDKITVTHKAGNWVKVKYGSKTGYVPASDLKANGAYSFAVYGTLRTGQSAIYMMNGYQQKVKNQRIDDHNLYRLSNKNVTFLVPQNNKTTVAEQFQYVGTTGKKKMVALDKYESTLKYKGKPMYNRHLVTMTDGSKSWSYLASKDVQQLAKSTGKPIKDGDFLKRS